MNQIMKKALLVLLTYSGMNMHSQVIWFETGDVWYINSAYYDWFFSEYISYYSTITCQGDTTINDQP